MSIAKMSTKQANKDERPLESDKLPNETDQLNTSVKDAWKSQCNTHQDS